VGGSQNEIRGDEGAPTNVLGYSQVNTIWKPIGSTIGTANNAFFPLKDIIEGRIFVLC
jgi:hypothetical protein